MTSSDIIIGLDTFFQHDNLGVAFKSFTQRNRIGKIKLTGTQPTVLGNQKFIRLALDRLFCVDHPIELITKPSFVNGRLVPDHSEYTYTFMLKKSFWDRSLQDGPMGDFLQFCDDNRINTSNDFVNVVTPLIHSMTKFIHTIPYMQKAKYRVIKHNFLHIVHSMGLCDSIRRQVSETNELLLEIMIGDFQFHIPARLQNFVDPLSLPLNENIYIKHRVTQFDRAFESHIHWLEHLKLTTKYLR